MFRGTFFTRWVMGLCLLSLSGCGPFKREELVQEIIKEDPGFAQVLDKHKELSSRIATYERELELKRSTVDRKIAQLHQELAEAAKVAKQKISEVKRLINPDRIRLEQALSLASKELRIKQTQRSEQGRSIAKLRKVVEDKNTAWDSKTKAQQKTQLEEMIQDSQRLDREITSLREHIRRLKLKLLLIKI